MLIELMSEIYWTKNDTYRTNQTRGKLNDKWSFVELISIAVKIKSDL